MATCTTHDSIGTTGTFRWGFVGVIQDIAPRASMHALPTVPRTVLPIARLTARNASPGMGFDGVGGSATKLSAN